MGTETLGIVLILRGVRERLGRPDRRGGDRQRRPRVQAAGVEERRQHDAGDGRAAGASSSSASPSSPAPTTSSRPRPAVGRPDGHRARGPDRVRVREPAVLHLPGRDRADPVPRGEHELQRLPAPGRDPGRRRVLARASSRSAATASPTAGGSSSWPPSRPACYVAFQGNTTRLIPLYSVGVFVCFTLSQTGMVLHWFRGREPGWRWRLVVNAIGALMTVVVLVIVLVEKFDARRLDRRDPHPGDRGR